MENKNCTLGIDEEKKRNKNLSSLKKGKQVTIDKVGNITVEENK